jgi:hypothetical protein
MLLPTMSSLRASSAARAPKHLPVLVLALQDHFLHPTAVSKRDLDLVRSKNCPTPPDQAIGAAQGRQTDAKNR